MDEDQASALAFAGIERLAAQIAAGSLSPVALTEALLGRIEAHGYLGSYATVTVDRALSRAYAAEAELAQGQYRGPLHGIPIALKDVIDTDFAPTTVGLAHRAGQKAARNATVVERLEMAGAIIVGKLTTAEGVLVGHNPAFPIPRNPRDADCWTGVSSSGSGVATAAGLCAASLGTDTGGSIRIPATVNGLTGLMPSWGRVSRDGLFPLAPTMDHVGPLTHSAVDAAIVLQAIAGRDPRDPTAVQDPPPDYRAALGAPLDGVRIGIDRAHVTTDVEDEVIAVVEAAETVLRNLGAVIVPVTMPPTDALLPAWNAICATEAALAHRQSYAAHKSSYGPEIAALIEAGQAVDVLDLTAAMQERVLYRSRIEALLGTVDILMMPAMPITVPRTDRLPALLSEGMYAVGRFTAPFDMTGTPAIVFPGGIDRRGHPIGLQCVGRRLDEARLLNIVHRFQRVTAWHCAHP